MELLDGLVVDGDGHLRVGVEGELHVVAGAVLRRHLFARQLQVLAASARGGRGTFSNQGRSRVLASCRETLCCKKKKQC